MLSLQWRCQHTLTASRAISRQSHANNALPLTDSISHTHLPKSNTNSCAAGTTCTGIVFDSTACGVAVCSGEDVHHVTFPLRSSAYLLRGTNSTELCYAATSFPSTLRSFIPLLTGGYTGVRSLPTRVRAIVLCLCALLCYAMPGTDIAR
eukprot:2579351-Rhodomonas_salina.1